MCQGASGFKVLSECPVAFIPAESNPISYVMTIN